MILQRGRIQAALARASKWPVTLVAAPAGSGKSVAIEQLLATLDDALCFDVRASHTSLTRFVRGLAAALEPRLPRVGQSLAIAHERATQSADPADVLATWFAEHLGNEPRTIVIDNYHHCENDATIAAFVAGAIERTRGTARWCIATRSIAQLPLAIWLARGDTDVPVDYQTMRLDAAEADALAAVLAPAADAALVQRLVEATNGSIGPMAFALATASSDSAIAERALAAGGNTYERFVDEALATLAPRDRRLVVDSALFPDLDSALMTAAGYDHAEERLAELRLKIPHAFEIRFDRLQFKTLFAGLLIDRLAAGGADALGEAYGRIGRALESTDRIVESLAYYIRGREFAAIARLVDARGLSLVDAGYGETIQEAIEKLDPMVQTSSPVILATKATFESRMGRFDTAESWFQLALDRATDVAVRDRIAYQYGTHLLRFFRPEAIALLEGLATGERVSSDLRCYALAALGPAYISDGRTADASATVKRALDLLDRTQSPHLRARAYHQAAYVALYHSDGAAARRLAADSLSLANEHGFFDIAAGALSVLYNAAADIDDDPVESVRLLDAVADCAAKSGSLVNHLLALIAKLEIEVERGNENAVAVLDEKLRTIDVRSSGRAAYEALLPSQALRASWTGDFAGAYRLLSTSAEQQWSPERKALRWAEIAVYGAAAELQAEATTAVRSSLDLLGALERTPRTLRARLFLALAMVLLGRGEAAIEQFEIVDGGRDALAPRMQALRRAFAAMGERYRGERNHGTLLALFAALDEHHYGGIARMMKTLPLADNATLRQQQLTPSERRVIEQFVAGDSFATDRRVDGIVAKLGCVDRGAVRRAVTRHPFARGLSNVISFPTEAVAQ